MDEKSEKIEIIFPQLTWLAYKSPALGVSSPFEQSVLISPNNISVLTFKLYNIPVHRQLK